MGKRKFRQNLSSIAYFVKELAKSQELSETSPDLEELEVEKTVEDASSERLSSNPSVKRRKVGLLGPGKEKYDATGLVERFENEYEAPEHLKKYVAQRERYFSLYYKGCILDEEGWYSVTPEKMADQIAERCRCDTILDAFCGVGGNAIAFAKTCNRVIAIDSSSTRLALARHNATIYGVADRIEFILADFLDFARSYSSRYTKSRKIDVVFLSPPWGGPSYIDGSPRKSNGVDEELDAEVQSSYSLDSIKPIPGSDLFKLSRQITRNIAFLLPRTTILSEISDLVPKSLDSSQPGDSEMIEIEEEYMGKKLKALTCYFGGLVSGQEEMFDGQ